MKLLRGDNIEHLKTMFSESVDAIVTDPPYGLSFMGKKWDYDVPSIELWRNVFRVLKPGGHVLSFGGTRTYHRMVVNIEDAGFEIRDQIQWIYGSGFPKSHDVSKGIDKMFGAKEHDSKRFNAAGDGEKSNGGSKFRSDHPEYIKPKGITDLAKKWQGFGSALKPANEPIVLARKPLSESTLAKNVLKYGTGAINIDGTRIEAKDQQVLDAVKRMTGNSKNGGEFINSKNIIPKPAQGRWPANVIFDEDAGEMLDEQSGELANSFRKNSSIGKPEDAQFKGIGNRGAILHNDSGGASRFFYCAKASKSERNKGLEGMPEHKFEAVIGSTKNQLKRMQDGEVTGERQNSPQANHHPTVKPLRLMEYLCKLITPPNGVILDPFMGSGTTGLAAKNLGFNFIGIELNEEYFEIAKKRIDKKERQLEVEFA